MKSNITYNPADPQIMASPFALYAQLREHDPVHWSPVLKSWIITRYNDNRTLLNADNLSVNKLSSFYQNLPDDDALKLRELIHYLNLWVAFRDPPDHTRMRRIMRHAFTPAAIDSLKPAITNIATTLLDNIEAAIKHGTDTQTDLIAHYASPLPAYVIMDLLGVPRDMLSEFKIWSDDMAVFIGGARNSENKYQRAQTGCKNMAGYFRATIASRRKHPQPGFLMDLIDARDSGDGLTDDELIATCMLVLFAGHETTTNLIGNSILALLQHPKARERFINEPSLTDSTIEEVMRYDGPTNSVVRTVAVPHTLHGKTLRQGERVFFMINSANRDERVFDAADQFIIDRAPNRHLTFGQGIHVCIGARLARVEGRIALREFFNRFSHPHLEPNQPLAWQDAMVPRGLRSLPTLLARQAG